MDSAWDAWRKHVRIHMRVPDDEQTMWSTWEPAILEKLIARHQKVNAYLKAKKQKKGYVMLVLVDDFADAGDKVMHSSTNVLTSLFVRGDILGVRVGCLHRSRKSSRPLYVPISDGCWYGDSGTAKNSWAF